MVCMRLPIRHVLYRQIIASQDQQILGVVRFRIFGEVEGAR
jgi:hypothetical protein